MSLDNVIFPDRWRLANRDPAAISDYQKVLFDAVKRASNKLRPLLLHAGTTVMRSVETPYGQTGNQARTVPPNSSKSTDKRWSGWIDSSKARGALYTSLDLKGFLNEARRYKRGYPIEKTVNWTTGHRTDKATYKVFGPTTKNYGELLVGRVYHTYRLKHSINIVDITPSAASEFFNAIESDEKYNKAKEALRLQPVHSLWRLAFDPMDYTASRPVGLSILLGYAVEGIKVASAQAEAPDISGRGENLVIGGDDGKKIEFLEPSGILVAGESNGHPALWHRETGGTTDARTIVPSSVLPITE